jgi:SAM-dependent methyltransferase
MTRRWKDRLTRLTQSARGVLSLPGQVGKLQEGQDGLHQKLVMLSALSQSLQDALADLRGTVPSPSQCDPFLRHEDATAHRERLIADVIAGDPSTKDAYSEIKSAIAALPDPAERAHAPLHEVRYLMTYMMTPPGPGVLVDIGASSVYSTPLKSLKQWSVEPVAILAFDYEREPLPFSDGSVDGVLICEVIEHFNFDPLYCMIEINRILKPNGFVLLTTPNAASWYSVYQALQQRHPSRWPVYAWNAPNSANHIHAREYLTSEVKLLLEAAGFGEIELTTRDYGISPPYRPIVGFPTEDRGETIFCRARKSGRPKKRAFQPLYLQDTPYDTGLDGPVAAITSAASNSH